MIKYSDKKLLSILKSKAKILGRTPKKSEIKEYYSIKVRFGSWNKGIIKAGLTPLKRYDYNKNNLIKIIKEWSEKNKRSPREEDFSKDPYLPDPSTILRKFNLEWEEILRLANLKPNLNYSHPEKYNDLELIEVIRNEYEKIHAVSLKDYDKRRSKSVPSLSYLKKRFNGNEQRLEEVIGLKNHPVRYSKKLLIKKLHLIYSTLKRTPGIQDLTLFGLNDSIYKKYFGTWLNAVKEAGLKIENPTHCKVKETDRELLEMYKIFSSKIGKALHGASAIDLNESNGIYNSDIFAVRFGSIYDLKKAAGFKPVRGGSKKYTKNELVIILRNIYKQQKRQPHISEFKKIKNIPSLSTYHRYFRTTKYNEIWKEALYEN